HHPPGTAGCQRRHRGDCGRIVAGGRVPGTGRRRRREMSALFSLCKVELQAMLNAMHLTGSKKSRAFAAPLAAALGGGIMAYVGAVYALPMATVLLPMGMGDLYWGQMLLVGFCM